MNLETKWLEDFLALADLRNFSRAAQQRNVTQPAFGRRIRALEQAVGFELIDRSSTPVGLTTQGRLFRTTARNLIRQMEEGLNQIQGISGPGYQPIDFAAAHSLSLSLLPSLLEEMSQFDVVSRSRVESIDMDLAVEALQQGRCDFLLGFDIEALMQPPFLSLPLGKTFMRPVSAVDASGDPLYSLTLNDSLPVLRYSPGSHMGRRVNTLLGRSTLKPSCHSVMESSLTDLLKVMAVKGEGVAWLPDYSTVNELRNGTLKPAGGEEWCIPLDIVLYRNDIRLHPGAEKFWSVLSKQCANGWSLSSQ
ncbi:LysR substrate-binding domain-containing protein [Parendozoicomonas haliclonae]|uniref:HTH-type transcriptional regulator YjiE n=1 Tax=Parendozoicomonas haliclonae TaxID=1960125 RepID=A0A1X7AL89_9GAMM|nr:LysR substrate-binding domain-containing protein [Parendozoicomonas haliclonae]SMA48242.1 HTH-type transcriptional regulator YjiE [Parendozoicomonas haliclonae]